MTVRDITAVLVRQLAELAESIARLIDHAVLACSPDQVLDPEATQPLANGLYRDRFGNLWEKTLFGWRLWLRSGAAVHAGRARSGIDSYVQSFAPFTPLLLDRSARWSRPR
ncbi:hypothetical protein [Nocardia crassostreae]|uniref:hypothetical protein n=1 Tax=Nocardia crassostreae TaxID=53428 RepID=UPI0012FC8302|nr:hypothetical protein [Nocardia crassostreae]